MEIMGGEGVTLGSVHYNPTEMKYSGSDSRREWFLLLLWSLTVLKEVCNSLNKVSLGSLVLKNKVEAIQKFLGKAWESCRSQEGKED